MKNRFTEICALVVVGILFAVTAGAADPPIKVGQQIPMDLVAKKLDGTEVKIAEIAKDKETLLVFFNTVCKNCYSELKLVDKNYVKGGNVNVYAIGVDMQGEKVLKSFKANLAPQFEILSDPAFAVPSAFGLTFTPSSVVIGADGKLAEVMPGYNPDTKAKIESLLGKK